MESRAVFKPKLSQKCSIELPPSPDGLLGEGATLAQVVGQEAQPPQKEETWVSSGCSGNESTVEPACKLHGCKVNLQLVPIRSSYTEL